MTPRILFLLSRLIFSGICLNVQSYNTISVDPSSGRDDSRCLNPLSGFRCATLSYALRYANHSTLYLLSATGDHSLVAGEPNTLANLRNITIASNGTSSSVRCARNAGLSFENVSSLAIENVVFLGCGTSHNSTSRNLSDTGSPYTLLKFTVALYFHLCDSVSLRHVTVTNSFGMGVIMYDTTGKNLISNSVFSDNVAQDGATPGGGGFCIEFTYSTPGDFCAPSSLHQNTGSMYDFTNSTFIGNVADHISINVPTFIIPYACNHDAFGKGGGLALFFKGSASDNTVRLSNCTFQNNTADWGGGLYVEFHDAAMGNVIEMESTFSNNSAAVEGGGLRVAYYTPGDNQNILANNFTLRSSTFMNNDAFTGGAIAVLPSLLSAEDPIPQILVFNCTFESNEAELGSAVYGSYIALSSVSLITPVIDFQMCTFTNNFLNAQEDRRVAEHYIGIGAMYLNGIDAKFNGAILFINNSGSALAVVGAYVESTLNESRTVFCWNLTFWNYDDNCTDEIGTGFGNLSAGKAETFPGMIYRLPISITDELGHDINGHTAFITTIGTQDPQPVATVDPGFYVAVNGVIQLNGNGSANQTIILTLEGTGNGMWHSEITVQLLPCPPGLSQDTNDLNGTCKCDPRSVYIPLVLFFLFVILFNVKLTTGPANAFILFSQAIVSSFDANFSSQLTIDVYKGTSVFFKICSAIYRVFNLDFQANLLKPFCIGTQFSTLDVIELNYVVAIMPCVMILIVMAFYQVTKLTCIFKITQCNTRYGTQKLSCTKAISFSPILAFAAFLLLSYSKVSITASKVLRYVSFRNASGLDIGVTRSYYAAQYDSGYWRYSLPSSFITVLIIVLPIILLGFPVRLFEKCISRVPAIMKHYPADKVNIFLDAFQGCFLDNRRYFASAYFFFRLIVNVGFVFLPNVSLQFTCQQFLCIAMVALIVLYNFIDIIFFSNLAFISILNGYIMQYGSDLNQQEIINALLVIFSILTSLPLIYMVGYLIWHFLLEPKKDKIVSILLSHVHKDMNVKATVENSSVTPVKFERNDNQEENVSVNIVTNASGDLDVLDARMREQVRKADRSPFPSNGHGNAH
eukprot:Em0001g450a